MTPPRPSGQPLPLPLSRARVDRDHTARDEPGLLDRLAVDPATRLLVLAGRDALVQGGAPRLRLLPATSDTGRALLDAAPLRLYLGRTLDAADDADAWAPVVAVVLADADAPELPEGAVWGSLRDLGADLDERDAGLFTEALALANWHATQGFAPRDGVPTDVGRSGWVRHPAGETEESGGTHLFPRTDAAVIVAVHDEDDRLLLGRNAAWGPNRFSLLAGFVEPGESLEAAAVREVFEESGHEVENPVYLGSQPWPFPASIMVGFEARLASGLSRSNGRPDGTEIVELRWFTRAELAAADASGEVLLPGGSSIARAIIDRWAAAIPEEE